MAAQIVLDTSAGTAVITNEVRQESSPLDIEGVSLDLTAEEIVTALNETRSRNS